MGSKLSLLERKVLLGKDNITWTSEPMYWGGYLRAEVYLTVYGQLSAVTGLTVMSNNQIC